MKKTDKMFRHSSSGLQKKPNMGGGGGQWGGGGRRVLTGTAAGLAEAVAVERAPIASAAERPQGAPLLPPPSPQPAPGGGPSRPD